MPLTDVLIRSAKPLDKPCRLKDGVGLYLEVRPEGGKWWRYRYKKAGRENMLSLGTYPEVTLSEARARRDDLRKQVAQGIDPGHARRAEKDTQATASANSFETIAREWYETRRHDWADSYGEKIMARFVADVFPYVGASPIAELKPPELLAVFRRIEKRGALETAQRARENVSQVFRYAVATGRAESDPSRDLKDALRKPMVQHFPAITKPQRLGELLRAIDGYSGTLVVRVALKLAPMLMLRPGELRHAQWDEFDLEGALWTIPGARMKRQKIGKLQGPPHLVPLPDQAVAALRELLPLADGQASAFAHQAAATTANATHCPCRGWRRWGTVFALVRRQRVPGQAAGRPRPGIPQAGRGAALPCDRRTDRPAENEIGSGSTKTAGTTVADRPRTRMDIGFQPDGGGRSERGHGGDRAGTAGRRDEPAQRPTLESGATHELGFKLA